MKIAVYAIAKNEEAHVKRFCESAALADAIIITDTGSTDNTVQIAKECGATVHQISIIPWRFDVARNAALALVPADIDVCVSMDLDEVLLPGWRDTIEQAWSEGVTRLNIGFDFGPNQTFYPSRVHNRHGYYWKYPCHEYITPDSRSKDDCGHTPHILMKHLPDRTKSRGSYIELLEMAVKEDPHCHRSSYYLGREYTYRAEWQKAIDELRRYLDLPTANWPLERSHAMRMIGDAYYKLDQDYLYWFRLACAEEPRLRENWYHLAQACYQKQLWAESYAAAKSGIEITTQAAQHAANPAAWGLLMYDFAAIAAYRLGFKEDAIKYGQQALDLAPNDERLIKNMSFYKE